MGWAEGFEPSATGTTIRRSTKLSYAHREGNSSIVTSGRRGCKFHRSAKRIGVTILDGKRSLTVAALIGLQRSQSRLLPQLVDALLYFGRHLNHAGPGAREALGGPFARGVDSHLRAVIRQAAGMVERIHRAQRKLDVALGIDIVQGFPGHFADVRSEEHTSELQSLRHLVC